MATRFYLPASGTAASSPTVSTGWLRSATGFVRAPLVPAKTNTALATHTSLFGGTATGGVCWRQWVSDTLDVDQTITGTMSMVVGKCGETSTGGDAHLAFVFRVMQGDTSTARGTLCQVLAISTEFALIAAAATRIHSAVAVTSVAGIAGDRLCMEIGVWGVTPVNENMQLRFGDPTATADFALSAALTTDLDPWVELSQNITFGSAGAVGHPASKRGGGIPGMRRTGGAW